MGNLQRRIEQLEQQAAPPGQVCVVFHNQDATPEEIAAKRAEVRAQTAPSDTVIHVVYGAQGAADA